MVSVANSASPIGQLGFLKTNLLGMNMYDWMPSMETVRIPFFKMPSLKDNIQDYYKNGMPVFAVNPSKAVNDSRKSQETVSIYPMQIWDRCFSVNPTLNLSLYERMASPTRELMEDIIDYTGGVDDTNKHVFNNLSTFTKYIIPLGILSEVVNPYNTGLRSANLGVAMYGPFRAVPNIWGSLATQNTVVGFIIRKVRQAPLFDLLSEAANIPYEENLSIEESYIMEPYVFTDYHQSVYG